MNKNQFLKGAIIFALTSLFAYLMYFQANALFGPITKPLLEFLILIPVFLIPSIFPGSFGRKFLIYVLLVVVCISCLIHFIHFQELEAFVLPYYAGVIFLMLLVEEFIVFIARKSNSAVVQLILIGISIAATLIFIFLTYTHVKDNINQFNNYQSYNEEICKGAYSITPQELKAYCDSFTPVNAYWDDVISKCNNAYNHLKQDPNYIDDQFISPRNYVHCVSKTDIFNQTPVSSYNLNATPPEYKDITVCDRAKTQDPEYFNAKNSNTDCYYRVAVQLEDPQYCAKTTINKDWCYQTIAYKKLDPSICLPIQDQSTRYTCEAVIKKDKTICKNITNVPDPEAYQYTCRNYVDRGTCSIVGCVVQNQ